MKLINHVLNIRRLIQQAFDNRFSRMGLKADASQPADQLPVDQQERRRHLDDIMQNHLSELGDYAEARQTAINECVYTLFNRIAAIKVMESKELFPEIICRRKENAGRSFEHNAWLEEHPEERNAEREGLKHFLLDQFNKLGEHIPLYRADYPYALMPTSDELFEIIEAFNAVEQDADCGEDVWKGDDILGWLYENFNAVEKTALKESDDKTEYDKVSLQSQVYTPQWVVKFLVDNTLGKEYMEMYPDSAIREKYQIANLTGRQERYPKDVQQMRLLDPACGSGNFLIYAFSLFYDLYTDQMENYGKDYSRRDIPKMIVENNLYGMDLDERAAQISQIALFIKAREMGGHRSHWPEFTNVVSTHFFLNDYAQVQTAFEAIDGLDEGKKIVMRQIWGDLQNAYKFGSLVRVDETLNALLPNNLNHTLFEEWEVDNLFAFRNQFMEQLRQKVNELGGKGSNAYTLAKTNDAISFLEAVSRKYDVVVANPPYTDSADFGTELKAFVEENYKRPYKFNINLYACFIKRCCELAEEDGKVGMIHPHTFMFIKTFEDVRKFMIEKTHVNVMVDYGLDRVNLFGPGILLDATFYTLDKGKNENSDGVYFNITANQQEKFKKGSLLEAYDDYLNNRPNSRVYLLPQDKLKNIKSWPFIYWISDEFREKFGGKTIIDYSSVITGLMTGNNLRHLRYHWEVDKKLISDNNKQHTQKWVRYQKGGSFNKWYGNNWLLVDFEDDGAHLATTDNKKFYFHEGITYSETGSKCVSFRYIEPKYVYDKKGPCIFCKEGIPFLYMLAFMNSHISFYIVDCLNPTVSTQVGDTKRIPFVLPANDIVEEVEALTKNNISIKKYICSYSIVEQNYSHSPIGTTSAPTDELTRYYSYENGLLTQILLNEAIINRIVFDVYELNDHDRQMVLDKEGIPVGDLSVSSAALVEYKQWLKDNTEFPASDDVWAHLDQLTVSDDQPQIKDFDTLYQNNNGWEEFCGKHKMSPVEVWYQFRHAGVLPPQRTQSLAFELITDVIRTVLEKDDDGIIPLGDKMGEERLALRIEREMMDRGYSTAQFSQVCQLLGCELEKYLRERFFQQLADHLNLFMYLPKTPFIWHLSSGEHHALDLFVSIYKWNRDALFRVRSIYAANRETTLRDRLNAIDTSNTEGRMEAAELREKLAELADFCQKTDDLLASGYDPKLDDGVGKNIAPLQKRKMISYEVLNSGQLKKYLNADW